MQNLEASVFLLAGPFQLVHLLQQRVCTFWFLKANKFCRMETCFRSWIQVGRVLKTDFWAYCPLRDVLDPRLKPLWRPLRAERVRLWLAYWLCSLEHDLSQNHSRLLHCLEQYHHVRTELWEFFYRHMFCCMKIWCEVFNIEKFIVKDEIYPEVNTSCLHGILPYVFVCLDGIIASALCFMCMWQDLLKSQSL